MVVVRIFENLRRRTTSLLFPSYPLNRFRLTPGLLLLKVFSRRSRFVMYTGFNVHDI